MTKYLIINIMYIILNIIKEFGANFKRTGGEKMSSIELMKVISETEEKADRIKKIGINDAKKLLAEAKRKAAYMVTEAEEEADAEYDIAIQKAEKEAIKVYEGIISQTSEKSKLILSEAEKNIPAGIKVVVERIVKSNVNS